MNWYATTGVGLEQLVRRELVALGVEVERVEQGRVRFRGDMEAAYRALIHLRCASRVVRELAFAEIESEQQLYEVVREIDWGRHLSASWTIRVALNLRSSRVKDGRFATYRIKDAICDWFRERVGRRPDVDTERPDLCVFCYLENRRFSVGLDAAGDPLHMRGYRVAQHPTSLREHLAAAMVLQSGWEPSRPLHDPFCGSGTILTEAAMIAARMPASAMRRRFACERWPDHDARRFGQLRQEAEAAVSWPESLRLSGADKSAGALEAARRNARALGCEARIRMERCDAADMPPLLEGHVVTNPPYGVRLGRPGGPIDAYRAFRARALLSEGSVVGVLTAGEAFEKAFSLRPFKRNRMNNGPIACQFLQYRIERG
jgi:23S rRNA G2445 N2-methylase RlmL